MWDLKAGLKNKIRKIVSMSVKTFFPLQIYVATKYKAFFEQTKMIQYKYVTRKEA